MNKEAAGFQLQWLGGAPAWRGEGRGPASHRNTNNNQSSNASGSQTNISRSIHAVDRIVGRAVTGWGGGEHQQNSNKHSDSKVDKTTAPHGTTARAPQEPCWQKIQPHTHHPSQPCWQDSIIDAAQPERLIISCWQGPPPGPMHSTATASHHHRTPANTGIHGFTTVASPHHPSSQY